MDKITLKPIFGESKSTRNYGEDGLITITLKEKEILVRTVYEFEELKDPEDQLSGWIHKHCNELSMTKKDSISQIGLAYDNEDEVYFVSVQGSGNKLWINVDSGDQAKSVYDVLTKWWLA